MAARRPGSAAVAAKKKVTKKVVPPAPAPAPTFAAKGTASPLVRKSSTTAVAAAPASPAPLKRAASEPGEDFDERPFVSTADNVAVYVRVRPLLRFETDRREVWSIGEQHIEDLETTKQHFFERVYGPDSDNSELHRDVAEPILSSCLRGYNGTIFAYGQTASGKTYTMSALTEDAVRYLFRTMVTMTDTVFLLRVSYLEIYNEKVQDLLARGSGELDIREVDGQFKCPGVQERIVTTEDEVAATVREGIANRQVGKSNINEHSSRSHAILRIVIEATSRDPEESEPAAGKKGVVRISELNLVDLAGSETLTDKYSADQQKETKYINVSLTQLKSVIQALSRNESFVPYRNSSLTKLLRQSLGGNARCALIACASPCVTHQRMTKSTLIFAQMAKRVTNRAIVNEEYDDSKVLIKQYRAQINALERKLQGFEALEIQKRRLQQDYEKLQRELNSLRDAEQQRAQLDQQLSQVSHTLVGGGVSMRPAATKMVSDEQMSAINRELEAVRNQNAMLERRLKGEVEAKTAIDADRKAKAKELESERKKTLAIESQLARLRSERDSLGAKMSEVDSWLLEYKRQGVDQDELFARLLHEYHVLESRNAKLSTENGDLLSIREAEKLDAEDRYRELKRKYDRAMEALTQAMQEQEAFVHQRGVLQEQVDVLQYELRRRRADAAAADLPRHAAVSAGALD